MMSIAWDIKYVQNLFRVAFDALYRSDSIIVNGNSTTNGDVNRYGVKGGVVLLMHLLG